MNKELYVSSTPHETKVALMEDDQLAEVFFERENEYTLAGSIYKGRVTRVLPGMQSAFVDIGLERDAFLYVSDFLELAGDEEEDEEFGEIPAPRGAIELGKAPPVQEAQRVETQTVSGGQDIEEDDESQAEDFAAPAQEQSEEEGESEAAGDHEGGDGARRWRGRRRRRGGRRGGGFEPERPKSTPTPTPAEPVEEPTLRAEARPRSRSGPPAGYTPIILPGESISKYRNRPQAIAEPEELSAESVAAAPLEDLTPAATTETTATVREEIQEEAAHLDQGYSVAEPEHAEASSAVEAEQVEAVPVSEGEQPPRSKRRWGSWRRKPANAEIAAPVEQHEAAQTQTPQQTKEPRIEPQASGSAQAEVGEDATQPGHTNEAASAESSRHEQEQSPHHDLEPVIAEPDHSKSEAQSEAESQAEHEAETPAGHYELSNAEQLAAPSVAPAGHTLEHEVLEDEEAEFQPVPDDVTAMREVAGDEELVLEEETLDANGYSERWVPKIADVDEDEVVAAEMRGEKIYAAEEEDQEVEENGEEEEVNDRAELRASAPTAGYQQRSAERPVPERRGGYRDRGRRGGSRRNNLRPRAGYRNQPLITDLLKEGQEVLIQIAKEPIGKKGARITSHIALPGRFLVYMPTVNHVGVSRKIASDEERQRLKRIVTSERENGLGGFIVRTAAVNIKEEDLRADIRFLKHLWAEIKTRTENSKSPALIYHDLNLVERVL
ncbi:MAG: ribonuclease E/G, partial [Candidatus Korobacteraceae bacterium]